jgi:DNA modification methylase
VSGIVREETIGGQRLICGDCLDVLPGLPENSVDCVVTDPPYPGIKRAYGYWTEEQWHAMMDRLVPECRRILTPTGSAVYVLQPNSERVGRMRPWLWEFMAKWTREWGMVQDAWWWNTCSPPSVHCHRDKGLMRPSTKACVWLGEADCFRDQSSVLLPNREHVKSSTDNTLRQGPSGWTYREARKYGAAIERGGTTPFNMNAMGNGGGGDTAGANGHGAGTPLALCDWWLRYICPPGGTVLEPFMGSGTVNVAAELRGKRGIGIERDTSYFDIACRRVEEAVRKREQAAAQLAFTEEGMA